ncbi:RloB family protein [Streptosporangium sp. NPDC051023]|uniref:RloB family protein n=1 Tax=Streptosporangium sp. NPDC051023 TaxID=3155410 RepID=UPI0034507A01
MSSRRVIPGDVPTGRRLGVNRAQKVVTVVCEGETEGDYLRFLEDRFGREKRFHINPYTRSKGFKPLGAVEYAVEKQKELYKAERENVWVIFDRDEHFDIEQAVTLARKNKIKVAFSHPSFDLWLWLHFARGCPAGQGGKSEFLVSRLQGVTGFANYAPDGNKRLKDPARQNALLPGIGQAIRLARSLDGRCESGFCGPAPVGTDGGRVPHDDRCPILKRDPSTGVYVLLESLGFTTV